ncbi:MAG: lactonase family protein [Actinomycetota bacterium]|nr:lactonase family protein [Actinomycetota bacterium]
MAGTPLIGAKASPGAVRGRRHGTIAYVGSWTSAERDGNGPGLSVYRLDQQTAQWSLIQSLPADDGNPATPEGPGVLPESPSMLAFDRTRRFLYATHADTDQVSSFTVNQRTGELTLLNTARTGGTNPVFVAVDPGNRWAVVTNYDEPGSVVTLPIRPDGSLGELVGQLRFPGHPGPHKEEQGGSYPHIAEFDPSGRWLVVADRGLDRLFTVRLNPRTGALDLHEAGTTQLREGSGPRHIAFHPTRSFAYTVDELRSCVTVFGWNSELGAFAPRQVLPSTPPDMTGDSRAAEIAVAPSGRFLYTSNRSGAGVIDPEQHADTIGCWRIDQSTGELHPVAWASTGGLQVRHFRLNSTGDRLYAANQSSSTIVTFAVDTGTGRLQRIGGALSTGTPTFILLNERP